jgi:6-pyruvoyltetrahydropterin/6-carboxytetrahydropterin synthase
MIAITKTFWFSAAHRIEGHPKCGRLHGHNYRVDITVAHPVSPRAMQAEHQLDASGFIIDFGELKKIVNVTLDNLDHRYMVSEANLRKNDIFYAATQRTDHEDDIVKLPLWQTSAELLATYIKHAIQQDLAEMGYPQVAVMEVRIWETPTSYAIS